MKQKFLNSMRRSAIWNFWQLEYLVEEFQVLKLVLILKNILSPEMYLQSFAQTFFLEEHILFAKSAM